MVKVSHNDAKAVSLAEAATQVAASHEDMIVKVPDGTVVKITPVPAPKPAYFFKGRPVYTQEQLEVMTPEELEAIGWIYPDESDWVDELNASEP